MSSEEARERREAERDPGEVDVDLHAAICRGGWLGEDAEGRPRPCPTCRPHLFEPKRHR